MSKASAIMFGKQTGDGTNVSRYEWSPDDDDNVVTQAEVAASDPVNYGTKRPLLAGLHRHWQRQHTLHHAATKRHADEWEPDDPSEVLRRFDGLNVVH